MAGRFSVEAVFKAIDRVSAPVTRMQNRVGKFTRKMERGFRNVNKVMGKMTRALKGVAVVGIGALAGLGAGIGVLVRQFSKIEDAEAAFTPVLGGAKQAREAVQLLNETAASTPFQFTTLAKSAEQLFPVIKGGTREAIKVLRMLGDTAGGNAQKLDSITRGFTKAMLKGKVDMESLNMIAEAGVPIFDDLAAVMGTKVNAGFFKMISAGKVTTTALTKAFEKMTSEGGMFFKGMEISSKTLSGRFSTLKDNISLTVAELGSVLAPTLKEIIGIVTTYAIKVREIVSANREMLNQRVITFFQMIRDNFQDIVKWGKRIAVGLGVFIAFITILKTLAVVLGVVNLLMAANPVTLIVLAMVAWIAAMATVVKFIDNIIGALDRMEGVAFVVLTPIRLLLKAIKFIKDNFGVVGKIASTIGNVLGFMGSDSGAEEDVSFGPEIVSPQDRVARSIEERRETSTAEVTIRDETGRAEMRKKGPMTGVRLALADSGSLLP